jgi:hypothetical protein
MTTDLIFAALLAVLTRIETKIDQLLGRAVHKVAA